MLGKGPKLEEPFRYETTFVFNNDFPALLEDVPEPEDTGDPLFKYVLFCFLMILHPSMNRIIMTFQICSRSRNLQGDVLQPEVERDIAVDEPERDQGRDRHLGWRDDQPGPEVQVG